MDGETGDDGYVMLGQVARSTRNTPAARAWYRDVLGLPELYTFGNLSFFDLGGVRLMLSENEGAGTAESLLYLRVPDIHAAKAAMEARGVVFTHAPHLIHRHEDGTEDGCEERHAEDDGEHQEQYLERAETLEPVGHGLILPDRPGARLTQRWRSSRCR